MTTNQNSITGPKKRPISPVPRHCTLNSAIRMATAMGITRGARCGAGTFSPSTALSTEMAGVIAPSP